MTETVAADKPVEDAVANKEEAVSQAISHERCSEPLQPKMPKTNRRLSARITGWAKGLGKKEQSTTPRDEVTKEEAELKTESTSPIADVAPTLDQPVLAEPIKIEQVSERILIACIDAYSVLGVRVKLSTLCSARCCCHRLDVLPCLERIILSILN